MTSTRAWVIDNIKRNGHKYYKAVELISDFLQISRAEAKKIYAEEIGGTEPKHHRRKRADV